MSEPNGTHIPEATITCNVALTDNFTLDEAADAFVQMAKCINRMAGLALQNATLSVANPIMQAALSASGNCEQTAICIAQLRQQQEQQRQQQSQIVSPHMRPGPVPVKLH